MNKLYRPSSDFGASCGPFHTNPQSIKAMRHSLRARHSFLAEVEMTRNAAMSDGTAYRLTTRVIGVGMNWPKQSQRDISPFPSHNNVRFKPLTKPIVRSLGVRCGASHFCGIIKAASPRGARTGINFGQRSLRWVGRESCNRTEIL